MTKKELEKHIADLSRLVTLAAEISTHRIVQIASIDNPSLSARLFNFWKCWDETYHPVSDAVIRIAAATKTPRSRKTQLKK